MTKCRCGCGKGIIIKPHHKYYGVSKYIKGHNNKGKRKNMIVFNMKKYCKCGCNKIIEIKDYHRLFGIPNYRHGHNNKGKSELWLNRKSHRKNLTMNQEYGEKKAKEIRKKNNYWLDKKQPIESSIKKSRAMIEQWQNKEYKEKTIKSILKGLMKRPTSFEKIMIDIIKKHNLPYKYVGDGAFILGGKNPDFINVNGKKICVEVYCDYWHPKNYEEIRTKHFKKYGWNTIFINEREIDNESKILGKIKGEICGEC